MPWSETDPMRERFRFVDDLESRLYTMTELSERFGISRKTGYKWKRRYEEAGIEGLRDLSRAPHVCPHRTPDHVVKDLLEARRAHPFWGPRKLLEVLRRRHPEWAWPAPSTAGDILKLSLIHI